LQRSGDGIAEYACHRVSPDRVSNPVNVNARNIFEPRLHIVQDYEFDFVSSSDKFMSQSANMISDVS